MCFQKLSIDAFLLASAACKLRDRALMGRFSSHSTYILILLMPLNLKWHVIPFMVLECEHSLENALPNLAASEYHPLIKRRSTI